MTTDDQSATGGVSEIPDCIGVLIFDDQAIVRQGLRGLLQDTEDIEVVGEACDGRQAVDEAKRLEPDVVLMDVVLPGTDGAQAIATIRARQPDVRILTLSGSDPEARIFATPRAGALGFISKTFPRKEVVAAIRRVSRDRPVMPPEMTLRLLQCNEPPPPKVDSLTRREIEILRLVARGLSNQEIAGCVHISKGTVRTHLGHIFGKLGVGNRVEATLCALRDGLTTLDECL